MLKYLKKIKFQCSYNKDGRISPWVVQWWPEGKGKKYSKSRSVSFKTKEERDEFVDNDFDVSILPPKNTNKGRKSYAEDREMQELPENWPEELTEVMKEVSEIRKKSGKPFSLLSDVFVAMKNLGYKKKSI